MDEITQINTYFRSFIYLIKNRLQIHREKIKIVELPKPLPINTWGNLPSDPLLFTWYYQLAKIKKLFIWYVLNFLRFFFQLLP